MKDKDKVYTAALYMRLSKDDDGNKESSSIGNQRKMLHAYAREHGFLVYDEYIDDGWSGTNFNRPAWKRLIADIEAEKVNLVVTKDLSRLGRDYIASGQYTEIYFPSKGIRYIAVNDGYDSEAPCTDIAPFKNVINEMYARDISRKIRSAFQTKMEEGAFIGNFPPYGYQKDPADKNHLLPDSCTAPIVKEMFRMADEGRSPSGIAGCFNERGVLTPLDYRRFKLPYRTFDDARVYKKWTSSTICKMLSNLVYLGCVVQGKTTKVSFKSPVTVQNPSSEWIVVRNMHEPLITPELFLRVKGRTVSRRIAPQTGFSNVFSGIAKCADCGRNMSTGRSRRKEGGYRLVCGAYKLYGTSRCSSHSIDYEILYQAVLKDLQQLLVLPPQAMAEHFDLAASGLFLVNGSRETKEITDLKQRECELDGITAHLYEDYEKGCLETSRFYRLLAAYEKEQKSVASRLRELTDRGQGGIADAGDLHSQKSGSSADFQLMTAQSDSGDIDGGNFESGNFESDNYESNNFDNGNFDGDNFDGDNFFTKEFKIDLLTPDLLRRTIDRIEISQASLKEGRQRGVGQQKVKIYYKFRLADGGSHTA